MATTMDNPKTQEWSTFYTALKAQLTSQLGSVYGPLQPFASAESVNWYWGEPNPAGGGELYNGATYDFLNTRVGIAPGGALQPEGGALNLDMAGVYRNITFGYSAADKQALVNNINLTKAQGDLLVSTYQGVFGTITPAQIAGAQAKTSPSLINTPVDFIIDYMVRYVWAGIAPTSPQGTYNVGLDPYTTQDLQSKLPFLPASASAVLSAVGNYIAVAQPIAPLRQALVNAMVPVSQLVAGTSDPTLQNGGIAIVNPVDSSTGRLGLGWSFTQVPADLLKSLGLDGGAGGGDLNVTFTATYADSHSLDVSVIGGGGGVIPILDFLGISVGGSASYEYNTYVGEDDSLEIVVNYPGLTVWQFTPQHFDGSQGWYDSTVIQQAVANGVLNPDGTAAATGYALATASPYDWSTTGTFGVLKGLIISQQPSVTINYATDHASDLYEQITQQSNLGVSLFGIDLFSAKESTTTTTNTKSTTNGSFSVTINPPAQQATGLQSTAWVVGGIVLWPGQGQA